MKPVRGWPHLTGGDTQYTRRRNEPPHQGHLDLLPCLLEFRFSALLSGFSLLPGLRRDRRVAVRLPSDPQIGLQLRSLRHDTRLQVAPGRDQELPRDSNDPDLPDAFAARGKAAIEPLRQLALGLKADPAPRQLDRAPPATRRQPRSIEASCCWSVCHACYAAASTCSAIAAATTVGERCSVGMWTPKSRA